MYILVPEYTLYITQVRCHLTQNMQIISLEPSSLLFPIIHHTHVIIRLINSEFGRYKCFFVSNRAVSSSVNFWCSSFICSFVGSGTFWIGIGVPTERSKLFYIFHFAISALLQSIPPICHEFVLNCKGNNSSNKFMDIT